MSSHVVTCPCNISSIERVPKKKAKSSSWELESWSATCCLFDPGEEISVTSLAENARDEGGHSRFALFDTRRGKAVADAARFGEAARKEKAGSEDQEKGRNGL